MYQIARPALFALDAERAHALTLRLGAFVSRSAALLAIVRAGYRPKPDPRLFVDALGLRFESPLGLAAGLDKDGVAIDLWEAIGFGFAELGTVTLGKGQPGNERPRLERLRPDRAIVNRMGFNNAGAAALAARIAGRTGRIPLGVNLGKAKATALDAASYDYAAALGPLWKQASYVVLNVSSPNTPGLRSLQSVSALLPLVERVSEENARLAAEHKAPPRPILIKIAPDLADEDVDAIADLALSNELAGIIATNTTLRRELARTASRIEGGLSGPPLAPRALELTRRLWKRCRGRLVIIGVGGISSAEDAYRRIRAGATLVQLYTGLIFEGPGLPGSIQRGLSERMERDGVASIQSVVGVDA